MTEMKILDREGKKWEFGLYVDDKASGNFCTEWAACSDEKKAEHLMICYNLVEKLPGEVRRLFEKRDRSCSGGESYHENEMRRDLLTLVSPPAPLTVDQVKPGKEFKFNGVGQVYVVPILTPNIEDMVRKHLCKSVMIIQRVGTPDISTTNKGAICELVEKKPPPAQTTVGDLEPGEGWKNNIGTEFTRLANNFAMPPADGLVPSFKDSFDLVWFHKDTPCQRREKK